MKRNASTFLVYMLIGAMLCLPLHAMAGQVVTESERNWARRILEGVERDKALPAPNTSNSVATLYYSNLSGNADLDPLQKGMALMLNHDLEKIGYKVDVTERVKMQAMAEELGLGPQGLVDSETAPRMGRLLGTKYVTGGEMVAGEPNQLVVEPLLIDVPSEMDLNQAVSSGDAADIIPVEKKLLFDAIELMGIELTYEEHAALSQPLSENPSALAALFAAVALSDNGEYEAAGEKYQEALAEDPDIPIAEDAFNELVELELIEAPEPPPEEEKKMSKWKIALIAAGAALAVGAIVGGSVAGAVIAADKITEDDEETTEDSGDSGGGDSGGGDSGGDDGDSSSSDEEEPDITPPYIEYTTPAEQSTLECREGELLIHWSEDMNRGGGDVATEPLQFRNMSQVWTRTWPAPDTLRIYWQHDEAYCNDLLGEDGEEWVEFQIKKYEDKADNGQTGQWYYEYNIKDNITEPEEEEEVI